MTSADRATPGSSTARGGQEFIEEHDLLATEETLQQIYDTIADKSEKMER